MLLVKAHAEGFQRATANFVCFHALWSPPQTRNSLRNPKEKGDCPQAVPQKKIPNYIDSLSSAMRFSTCSAFC